MQRAVDARNRDLGAELQHAFGDVVDDEHDVGREHGGSHRGWIVERADSRESTGAPTSMPAATVACPARIAVSQAGYTVNPRSGRHSCEYSHSPSSSFATERV